MPEIGPGLKHLSKEQFGRVLYRKMLEKGWNQSELARAADIPRDSVSKYIRGITVPSQQSLQALAVALGTRPQARKNYGILRNEELRLRAEYESRRGETAARAGAE